MTRGMDETVSGFVSAFAVRRATRAAHIPLADATTGENVLKAIPTAVPNKGIYELRPAKKRKTTAETGYWAARNSSSHSTLEKIVPPRNEPKVVGKDVESETDELDSGEETESNSSGCGATEPLRTGASIQKLFHPLSSFVPTKDNVLAETAEDWTIRLSVKDTLTLVGQYDIRVHSGAVAILGAIIRGVSRIHRVYAPSTNSLPSIRAVPDPFGTENQYAVITILVCSSRVRMLKELSPKFRGIWNRNPVPSEGSRPSIDLSRRSFLYIKDSIDDRDRRLLIPLQIPADWQSTIHQLRSTELKKPPAVLICGPKSSGKSTFGRLLANSMLNRYHPDPRSSGERGVDGVAFLDLDPGQPEYSPPGEVSLIHLRSYNLGVPFTHPMIAAGEDNRLIRAHHLGSVSLKDDPRHHQKCALDLLSHYKSMRSRHPSCPLIVNCSGWVQGSALELLDQLIHHWPFTDVVYTSRLGPTEVLETLAETTNIAGVPLWTLTTPESQYAPRTSADLRMMRMLSYFHLDEPEGGHLRWNASLITDIPPLTVRYAGVGQDIFGIMIYGEEQDPEYLAGILEGCVVGLVVIEDDTAVKYDETAITYGDEGPAMMEQGSEKDDVVESEHIERVQPDTWRTHSHSGSESMHTGVTDSGNDNGSFHPRLQRRKTRNPGLRKRRGAGTPHHLRHSFISRTAEDLPYLFSGSGTNRPPDPSKSHSIGQALIRGINVRTKTLHLVTPIPQSTFQALRQLNTKIVLARGKLDTPTWAYREEYCAAAAARRRGGRRNKKKAELTEAEREETQMEQRHDAADELRAWAAGTPWATVVDGKEPRSSGAKVWKRRDFRPRPGEE